MAVGICRQSNHESVLRHRKLICNRSSWLTLIWCAWIVILTQSFVWNAPPPKRKNYKGRNPNTLRYIESCGTEANSCQSRFGRKARRRKWRSGRWRKDLHPHWITLSTGIRALNSSKDKITNPKIKLLIKETMFCFNFVFCFNKTLSIYSQYRKNAGHAPSHSVVWSFLSWSEIKTCKFHPGRLDKATCLW